MGDLIRIQGLALPGSDRLIDAELELIGLTGRRPPPEWDEICRELVRPAAGAEVGLDAYQLALNLAARVLAAFPPVRRATITVRSQPLNIDGIAVESVMITVTRERSRQTRQGTSLTRPRPR